MHISKDVGLPLVQAFEGCLKPAQGRPGFFVPYTCPAGVLTQGWGHTNLGNIPPKVTPGVIWSKLECDQALANDMVKFEARVDKILKGVPLFQHQFDALVSFDFNTGGLDRSSIPAKIRAGRWDEVSDVLDRWNKANGQVLNGLVRRRKAEGLLFQGKVDEALRVAGTHRATGELMPQKVERPSPPPAEVVKRTGSEIGVAVGGGAAAGVPKPTNDQQFSSAVMWLGLAFVVIGVILLVRKYKLIDADWA